MHMLRGFALAVVLALPATALAQADSTARAEEPAPAPAGTPVTQEQLNAALEGMNEQTAAMSAELDKLKRFKFSGYLQARYEIGEASADTVRLIAPTASSTGTVTPANLERFYIRRARLKLTYDSSPLSRAVLYFDGGSDRTIRLLEAYVTLLDPWTPLHDHAFSAGQFNVPFGYELERSSSVRELPERSRAENVLFSGERDRGLKLDSQWTPRLSTSFAMLNGGGINSTDFPTIDPTAAKDLTARARWSQGTWDAAASWYSGHQTTPLTGPDLQTEKSRLGLDAQLFFATPRAGGGSLKAEGYLGHEVNPDSVRSIISGASGARLVLPGRNAEHIATDFRGGYVMLVQNAGERLQLAARYDVWDPNVDIDHDQYRRFSVGVNAFYDGFTRLTVSYDAVTTEVAAAGGQFKDPHDNLWTFQFQHKF